MINKKSFSAFILIFWGFWGVAIEKGLSPAPIGSLAQSLTIDEAEAKTLSNSQQILSADFHLKSAREELESLQASRYPKLSLTGHFQSIEDVPKIKVGLIEQNLSDHHQYSIGPTLTYNLWDGGYKKHLAESLQWAEKSALIEKKIAETDTKFRLRSSYVKAQLAVVTYKLSQDSLRVAKEQAMDIQNKYRAGAISRVDLLSSRLELSHAEIRESQAKSDLNSAFMNLSRLMGVSDYKIHWKLTAWENEITALIHQSSDPKHELEPTFMAENLKVKAMEIKAKSLQSLAESKTSGYWPQIQLSARSSLDYPFGSQKTQIHQNTLMATLQWDLFDFSSSRLEKSKHLAEASAVEYQAAALREELEQQYRETQELQKSLMDQLKSATQAEDNSAQLAQLKKQTYHMGKLSFIDVALSQVQHLESQVRRAKIEAQLLIQKHQLDYLQSKISFNDEQTR